MRASTAVALALLIALAFGMSSPAGAAPPSEEERQARKAYRQAEQYFRGGLFAEALAQYQAGYDAFPLPGFLINIAQCHRRLGDLRKARATYRKFLMVAPESPHAGQVRGLVTELDRLIAELDEEAKEANQTKGGEPESAPTAEAAPPPQPAPAPRVPEAVPPPGADPQPALALAATRSPIDRAEAEPSGGRRRWWIWALVGAGVVAAGTTAALVLAAPEATTIHDGTLGTLRR